jgi:hypothetical protein
LGGIGEVIFRVTILYNTTGVFLSFIIFDGTSSSPKPLEVFNQKLDSSFESFFFALLDHGIALDFVGIVATSIIIWAKITYQIATNSKAVGTARKVLANVTRFVFSVTEKFVCLRLQFLHDVERVSY